MSIRTTLILLVTAALAACVSGSRSDPEFRLTATAVEVEPSPVMQTIPPDATRQERAGILAAIAESAMERQVFVNAVIHRPEAVQLPKAVIRDGQTCTLFVGEVDDEGNEDGLQVHVLVEGSTAKLQAYEMERGQVIAHQELVIPVKSLE